MGPEKTTDKTLAIIHLALVIGQILFAVICVMLIEKTEIILNDTSDIFLFLVPAFAVFGLIASNLVFKKMLDQLNQKNNPADKLAAYRSAFIIRCALLEAPSLLGIVAYYLQGNFLYIFISGFIILFFITIRPTKEKIEIDLNIA